MQFIYYYVQKKKRCFKIEVIILILLTNWKSLRISSSSGIQEPVYGGGGFCVEPSVIELIIVALCKLETEKRMDLLFLL